MDWSCNLSPADPLPASDFLQPSVSHFVERCFRRHCHFRQRWPPCCCCCCARPGRHVLPSFLPRQYRNGKCAQWSFILQSGFLPFSIKFIHPQTNKTFQIGCGLRCRMCQSVRQSAILPIRRSYPTHFTAIQSCPYAKQVFNHDAHNCALSPGRPVQCQMAKHRFNSFHLTTDGADAISLLACIQPCQDRREKVCWQK